MNLSYDASFCNTLESGGQRDRNAITRGVVPKRNIAGAHSLDVPPLLAEEEFFSTIAN